MNLRIKEICKEKGITLQEVAKQIGISNVNLSNSLNGNPTLQRLGQVAKVLGVELRELFPKQEKLPLMGFVQYKEEIYKIEDIETIRRILTRIERDITADK